MARLVYSSEVASSLSLPLGNRRARFVGRSISGLGIIPRRASDWQRYTLAQHHAAQLLTSLQSALAIVLYL
jgi:hypothetical protein